MDSDEHPQPEPRGALVPPSRRPPTAIGTNTPEPPRPPQRSRHVHVERTIHFGPDLKAAINRVLDAVDDVAEIIAVELGIRAASGRSK